MMKKSLYAVMAAVMILCSACAGQPVSEEDIEMISDAGTVSEGDVKEEAGEEIEEDAKKDIERNAEEAPDVTLEIKANGKSDNSIRAQIIYETKEDNDFAEDGSALYTSRCVYPVVTMEENKGAAEKINAYIQKEVDDFLSDTSIRDDAREFYEDCLSYEDINFHTYSHNFDMAVTRNDSNVISCCTTTSSYTGGAHGGWYNSGLNFNAKTGELIDFSDLGENKKTFQTSTLDYVKELTTTNAYRKIMWGDNYDLEEILYQDERWYFSTSGLVFFSNPYELGAFSSGNIEFTVPYADLEGMGLRKEYSYKENLTIKLQTEEICSFDLNGNGREEEIRFYIENPGSANTNVHFIIDGTDYASENAELSGQLSDQDYLFCWTQCFLYDMDTEDDMTEIAFQMNSSDWEDEKAVPYTFFYRYEKDGTLTYLGKMKGTVTDF